MTEVEPTPVDLPTWKRDFPYQAAAEEDVTRREFARYLVAGAGVMATGNVVAGTPKVFGQLLPVIQAYRPANMQA